MAATQGAMRAWVGLVDWMAGCKLPAALTRRDARCPAFNRIPRRPGHPLAANSISGGSFAEGRALTAPYVVPVGRAAVRHHDQVLRANRDVVLIGHGKYTSNRPPFCGQTGSFVFTDHGTPNLGVPFRLSSVHNHRMLQWLIIQKPDRHAAITKREAAQLTAVVAI